MDEFFEALTGGVVWGAGFALAAGILGGLGQGMRPLAKNVIKGSITVSDWMRSAAAETRETFADIYEEARSERTQRPTETTEMTEPRPAAAGRAMRAKAETETGIAQ